MDNKILSKGAEIISNASLGQKIGVGIGTGGLGLMGIGAITKGSSARKELKADKYEAKADRANDTGNNLMVAGAIATAGVGGYGIAHAVSAFSKAR